MLKSSYHGPLSVLAHSYGGNFAASFAVYFLATIATARRSLGSPAAAACALLVGEAIEVTNGFDLMSNVYDPVDLIANAAGVGAGLAVDPKFRRRIFV